MATHRHTTESAPEKTIKSILKVTFKILLIINEFDAKTELLQLLLRQDTIPSFIKTNFHRFPLKMENHLEWL